MAESCRLYYITDRSAFSGDERTRWRRLLDKISEAAACGVDYIQLREKDLPACKLESLAREAMRVVRQENKAAAGRWRTALFINSCTDVALAAAADGVHLRAGDVSPQDVRKAWALSFNDASSTPLIGVSCHSPEGVIDAAANGATFAVFAPVFEKKDARGGSPAGLEALRQASLAKIPVLALGGVTLQNASACLRAGAAGIAAIRLFQENNIAVVVRALRG